MAVETLPYDVQNCILMHLMYGVSERVLDFRGYSKHLSPRYLTGSACYASVCRRWQEVVEQEVFHTLRLNGERMTDASIILTPARQRQIRYIQLDVVLPEYGKELYAEVETAEEQQQNNEVFAQTTSAFFQLVQNWPKETLRDANITVLLDVFSPGDETHCEWGHFERTMGNDPDIFEDRFEKSTIESETSEDLPALNGIVCLENSVRRHVQRGVSPTTCCLLATKFSRLQKLSLELYDHDYSQNRAQLRRKFGEAIQKLPDSLKELSLEYKAKSDAETVTESLDDSLSTSLRIFSQRLERLYIYDGAIGDDLFWPQADFSGMDPPYWHNLTTCHFIYAPNTPSGHGRFCYDYESSLHTPSTHLGNLYTSAANAALQMPQLRELMMGPATERIYHTFLYRVNESRTAAEAMWISYPVYKPQPAVLKLWKDVAMKHTGGELRVFIGKTPDNLIIPPDEETRLESLRALKACRRMLTMLNRPLG